MAASTKKQSYIITTAEDIPVNEIADDKIGSMVSGANICDAVDIMSTSHEPQLEDVMTSPEFHTITANLTPAEAKKLGSETGIKDVELDEEVFACVEGDSGLVESDVEEDFAGNFLDTLDLTAGNFDEELAEEYDADVTMLDSEMSDEEMKEQAALELVRDIDIDSEIDFDLDGQIIHLDEELSKIAAELSPLQKAITGDAKQLIVSLARELQTDIRNDISPEILEQKISQIVMDLNVGLDQAASSQVRDYITYGLKMIYAPLAWRYTKGAHARVAVLDTGIARRHSDLRVYGGASFVPGVTSWNDDHGHGTHVAGTIAAAMNNRGVVGVAPQSKLYAVKVLNRAGSGQISWILNGLAACYRARMHIVNLSLGSLASTHNTNTYSRAYERAGQMLRRRGILAVAAAGNSARTNKPYVNNPARCPSFLAVGAVDKNYRRANFSSYGPQVELAGPGVNVWSTTKNGRYGQKSGTSMATPHIAGVAALNKSRRPSLSGDQIRRRMNLTARDLGPHGRDPFYGYGLVNAYRSVR